MEIKFCTRWQYPIEAIFRALELCEKQLEWYVCEENHIYVSKFVWGNGQIEEHILPLNNEYWDWEKEIESTTGKRIEEADCDDSVWCFIPFSKERWRNWPSENSFSRYINVSAIHVKKPDWKKLELI